jgi:NAD(P)-dependent dehydrogenase (short-subunit alcohol dehydrogenase family)
MEERTSRVRWREVDESMFQLKDKVAVVTGGGTGIGRAIALAMAEAGASVVVCGLRLGQCEETCLEISRRFGSKTLAHPCDVCSKAEIETLVDKVVSEFGRLDILVNNAGMTSKVHVFDLTEEEWDRVINTNLKGPFLFSQAAGRAMARSGGGVIINIGSQLGEVARPHKAHYVSSKGGIRMLTKALALDLAAYGIRVNNVAPGPVDTELAAPLLKDPVSRSAVLDRIPLGRIGQPGDIAGAVVFLASEAASFITGTTLVVDGGYLTM